MNKKQLKHVIGLVNILLQMQEPINIFINGKIVPECWKIYCDDNYLVLCYAEELNLDVKRSRKYIYLDCIHDITIEREGELI